MKKSKSDNSDEYVEYDKCPACKGNMKKGATKCSKCLYRKCGKEECKKYILKEKPFIYCYNCNIAEKLKK